MALINNQKFGLTKWWLTCALEVVQSDREIFRSGKMREARNKFIAGSNMLKAIREWLLAAQVIRKANENGQYELTKFGMAIKQNDKNLERSSTWWAIHLAICFPDRHNSESTKEEPYVSLFSLLNNMSKGWVSYDELEVQVTNKLSLKYAEESVKSALVGVLNMFRADQPLADIGILDFQKNFNRLRLGSPKVSDEAIVYGLAMARVSLFPTRATVDFMELIKNNVNAYLCLTPDEFRKRIRTISHNDPWRTFFSFSENVNLNSIFFSENLSPMKTLLILLQSEKDSWE